MQVEGGDAPVAEFAPAVTGAVDYARQREVVAGQGEDGVRRTLLGDGLLGGVDDDACVDLAGTASEIPGCEAQLVDAVGPVGGVERGRGNEAVDGGGCGALLGQGLPLRPLSPGPSPALGRGEMGGGEFELPAHELALGELGLEGRGGGEFDGLAAGAGAGQGAAPGQRRRGGVGDGDGHLAHAALADDLGGVVERVGRRPGVRHPHGQDVLRAERLRGKKTGQRRVDSPRDAHNPAAEAGALRLAAQETGEDAARQAGIDLEGAG